MVTPVRRIASLDDSSPILRLSNGGCIDDRLVGGMGLDGMSREEGQRVTSPDENPASALWQSAFERQPHATSALSRLYPVDGGTRILS